MKLPGEYLGGLEKCSSTQLRLRRLATPFSDGPTSMPPPFNLWQSPHELRWYTRAPCTANSGAWWRAVALSGLSLSRNAASAFNCASFSWMGGIELPGRTPEGALKCLMSQAASRCMAVRARSGPILAPPSPPTEWQLEQFS